MKKIIMSLVACLLLGALALTGLAAENALVLSSVDAAPGEMIYMTLSLTEPVVGDSMAVTYTYDTNILEPVPGSCSWEQKGMLQDFGKTNDAGVWAGKETVKLQGDICVLAFRVLDKAKLVQSTVTCTLIVKNSSQEAGRYIAEGTVYQHCEHEYGSWTDIGSLGHSRVCSKCHRQQTQSHNYDSGQDKTDASGATVKQFTCIDCRAYKQLRLDQAGGKEEITFSPGTTIPNTNGSGNQGGVTDGDSHAGHDHSTDSIVQGSADSTKPGVSDQASQPHDHTHTDEIKAQEAGDPKVTAFVIAGVVVVLIAAAVLFLKKKK